MSWALTAFRCALPYLMCLPLLLQGGGNGGNNGNFNLGNLNGNGNGAYNTGNQNGNTNGNYNMCASAPLPITALNLAAPRHQPGFLQITPHPLGGG